MDPKRPLPPIPRAGTASQLQKPKKEVDPEVAKRLKDLYAVFNYYDTDRDGRIDQRTMKKMPGPALRHLTGINTRISLVWNLSSARVEELDLLGFYNPPVPSSDAITFEMFSSAAMGLENNLSEAGKIKRAFHLMKPNNASRTISHEEFHKFLHHVGMDISEDHAERITELISTYGDDHFTEQELVAYVLEAEEALKKKELNKKKKEAAEAKTLGKKK